MYIMKTKILNWIKANRLTANIVIKALISIFTLLISYCIAIYPIVVIIVNIIVISSLLTVVWVIWNSKIDVFEFIDNDEENDK